MSDSRSIAPSKVRVPHARALPRERLDDALGSIWEIGFGLVTAPAGSGKTTLLTQFAQAAGVPTAWYAAEPGDASTSALLAHLHRALRPALGVTSAPWPTLEAAVEDLERWSGDRALLVVDDLHELAGTEAETGIGWLVEHRPRFLTVLAASRRPPRFNLSRLRVSGVVLELGADDLRFRSWEVERLFRDFYGEPLPPEDLASLARRTEGWAAGLQLFHLATRGKPAGERRRLVAALGTRSRLVREYLARNVLGELADDLREFLLGTCVLGRLTGPLCDELLERTGSAELLELLEQRQIFTFMVEPFGDDEAPAYRYHEVLRAHLEALLRERVGADAAHERYRRAAALLESAGALPEALQGHCRAEDWEAAARLLGGRGEQVIGDTGAWLAALPPSLADHDPWLLLAMARHDVSAGRLAAAVDRYRAAESAFGAGGPRDIATSERLAASAWLQPATPPSPGWSGALLAALRRSPLAVREASLRQDDCTSRLVAGLASLVAGEVVAALDLLHAVAECDECPGWAVAAAGVAAALAANLAEVDGPPGEVEQSGLEAERLGVPLLARLARSVLALTGRAGGSADALAAEAAAERDGDAWGSALAALWGGLGSLRGESPDAAMLRRAAGRFDRLGAPVLAVWAEAGAAVADVADGRARPADIDAVVSRSRLLGVPGAQALALVALGRATRYAEHLAQAAPLARKCGLDLDGLAPHDRTTVVELPGPDLAGSAETGDIAGLTGRHVVLRCFDRFRLTVDGVEVDCTAVKPRARAALHLLALKAGAPVHRDVLVDALWPDVDARAGTRSLQVALSAVRQMLEPGVARGAAALLAREGDTYSLAIPADADVDLRVFDDGLAAARSARVAGDRDAEAAALEGVLEIYAGDLLSEVGAAEWVVKARERYRLDAAEAALALAVIRLRAKDFPAAARVAERGLRIDRYNDQLWRLASAAYDGAGDAVSSARVRAGYDEVLAELGLPPASP